MAHVPLLIIIGRDNPVLRAKSQLVKTFDGGLKKLVLEMAAAMQEVKGIGIAAPQVGQNQQLFLIDKEAFNSKETTFKFLKGPILDTSVFLAVVNPTIITKGGGKGLAEEGCLSLPNQNGYVSRVKKLILKAQTVDGKSFKLQARGLLARVIQHEYDHLQGILICDKFIDQP